MRLLWTSALGAAGLALGAFSGMAHAADLDLSVYTYAYTVNEIDYPVSNILFEEEAPDPSGDNGVVQGFGYFFPGYTESLSSESNSVYFYPFLGQLATGTFLIGLAKDLPGDDPGQEHVVLFTNDAFAQSAQGAAWSTLFPNTSEDGLIAFMDATDVTQFPDAADVLNFIAGDATTSGIAFAPGDPFTAIAFSDGQIIGTGISSVFVSTPTTPVPEPATWALLIAGFLGLGCAGLRRKRDLSIVR